jgi:predicted TIM-barrel fold metal-dependent hydrolase
MEKDNLWQTIYDEINKIKVVDTHEHLGKELPIFRPNKLIKMNLAKFIAYSYLYGDLISSGMKPIPRDKLAWEDLKPHLEDVKTTVYYKYVIRALKDFFGFEGESITNGNWETISNRISEKTQNHVDWELQVLDLMNVHRIILEISEKCILKTDLINDQRLVQIFKADDLIMGDLTVAKKLLHKSAETLEDYLSALDVAFDMAIKNRTIGVKSSLAYLRIISYDKVEKSVAQRIFNNGLRHATPTEMKNFQDFMMHTVCEKCAEYKLPFEFHTGLQADNFNLLTYSNPLLLQNLIKEYKKVNFVLFHGGYPYIHEVGVLAKYFPNVYLDACWLSDISISAYKRALTDWLEIVPSNKIFAWGGDQTVIEHSYASLLLAKDLITDVLVEKINSGIFNLNLARSVMKKILQENAVNLFRL